MPEGFVVHAEDFIESPVLRSRRATSVQESAGSALLSATLGAFIDGLGRLATFIGALEATFTAKTWKTQIPSNLAKPGSAKLKSSGRVTAAERDRWMERRDAHLARIQRDPARVVPAGTHVNVAVFEEWIDGELSDEYAEKYMGGHLGCELCQAVYERYRVLRITSLLQRSVSG